MRLMIFLLSWRLALALVAAAPAPAQEENFLISGKLTNAVPLVEGPNDRNIAQVVTTIFENAHYLRQPLNDEQSSKFLDRYLDSLDNLHLYFLQSDVQQFEKYRTTLDDLTKGIRRPEKMQAACERMDRMREQNRRLFGDQNIAVDLIREARNRS